jgi:hypothetical protein
VCFACDVEGGESRSNYSRKWVPVGAHSPCPNPQGCEVWSAATPWVAFVRAQLVLCDRPSCWSESAFGAANRRWKGKGSCWNSEESWIVGEE